MTLQTPHNNTAGVITTSMLYVAKNGNDSNNGSISSPLLTIGAAITLATSGTSIMINPGIYTENLTFKAGVSLEGMQSRTAIIVGNHVANFIGTVYIHSIDFQSSTGVPISFSGANATNLQLDDCHIDSLAGGSHCIDHSNTNASSRLLCDAAAFNVAVSTTAKIFNSAATSAGTVIWEDVSARINDNLDHIALNILGSITFTHTFDDVHGQIVVGNTASYTGVDLTLQTSTVAVLTTTSSTASILANIVCLTTAIPAFTGTGLLAYGSIGYGSTGDGFAATLNAGAGASPIPVSPIQFHPQALSTLPYDGQLQYTGTTFVLTKGTSRYQLDQQYCIASLIGANMNSIADQPIILPTGRYIIDKITVDNASVSLTTAAGGIYTGAAKTGTIIVAATQAYSALTATTKFLDLTLTAIVGTDILTATIIYLSLTTAQGVAATANIHIYGRRLDQ